MKQAGIDGRFSNHSLRATTTTQIFQKGVDEQLIKCVTGHKSDAVRLYKRPSDKLLKTACDETVVSKGMPKSRKRSLPERKVENSTDYVAPLDFDIDSYKISEDSKVTNKLDDSVSESTKSHKKNCPFVDKAGDCTGICGLLKKIDAKATEKKKVKKVKLSLEYDQWHVELDWRDHGVQCVRSMSFWAETCPRHVFDQ